MNSRQLRQMGFKYMDSPYVDDSGRIKFSCKPKMFCNIVYAILIDDKLMYIGQTRDFYTRVHTYRNAKYWKNAWKSNKRKTNLLEKSVGCGKDVSFYCLNSANTWFDEMTLIKNLSPKWNHVFNT